MSVELLEKASEPLEPYSTDITHSATDQFDQDFALSRLSTIQDALFEVDEAIERILNGSYGVCEETGRPIPEARLKAAPWTRFARDIEERLEKDAIVSGLHLVRAGLVRGPLGGDDQVFEGIGEEETGEAWRMMKPCGAWTRRSLEQIVTSPCPATGAALRIIKIQIVHQDLR